MTYFSVAYCLLQNFSYCIGGLGWIIIGLSKHTFCPNPLNFNLIWSASIIHQEKDTDTFQSNGLLLWNHFHTLNLWFHKAIWISLLKPILIKRQAVRQSDSVDIWDIDTQCQLISMLIWPQPKTSMFRFDKLQLNLFSRFNYSNFNIINSSLYINS